MIYKKVKRKPKFETGTIIGAEVIKVDGDFILFKKPRVDLFRGKKYNGHYIILINFKENKECSFWIRDITELDKPEIFNLYYEELVNAINKIIKKK